MGGGGGGRRRPDVYLFQIVALVLYNTKIDVNARNKKGWTALDIHYIVTNREDVEPVYLESNDLKDTETAETIEDLLRIDGAKRLRELFLPYQPEWQNKWQKNQNETLMIVSSLIGAMAFQVGLSPPGSVWQDNSGHEAGKSILAYRYPNWYPFLMYVNTAGFLLSLSTILLLIMALPAEGKVFGVIRSCASWLTIMATAFVYTYCITVVTPNMRQSASYAIVYLVMTWACMISLYLLKHTRQSIRSFMEERQNQKKNRERITWTRPQKQLSIKVDGREDEAGFSPNVEAGASKKIEAGGSESDEVGGSESDEAGISKEIEVAVSDEIEADRTGFDEAGITKEIEGGGSKEIEAVRSRSDKADINKKMEDGRSESEEAGGSQEIEVSGI
ncbi:hypothetical protein RHMOL_Rhmol01G0038700 [Rhododendron molle]|uniref:Uncharacterized protein n=1 Tax=Rhododendron molle TaxID=49168 RepID=A0ACC0PZA4_RHOML|nr:hypothetical protein RHMOL_Rhmol01G0038700 [Rhododendron molle]